MVYADGKVYAVDLHRGLLVIDAAEGKLLTQTASISSTSAKQLGLKSA